MRHPRRLLVGVAVLALLAGLYLVVGHGSSPLERKQADVLPAVTLRALGGSGESIDLASLKGPAVLNFWANWCGPCKKELPIYEQFHTTTPSVRLIGVNTLDTQPKLAEKMVASTGVTYPQVVDTDGKVLGAKALPVLVMVDATGKVVYRKAIQIHSAAELASLVKKHLGTAS